MSPRWIFVTLVLLAVFTAGAYFYVNSGPEYSAPTEEQIAKSKEYLAIIPTLEAQAETDYGNAQLHAVMAMMYAYAFAAHTDDTTYFERMVSEFAVSLKIEDDQKVKSYFQQIYIAYHTHRTPKNIFTPTSESFKKWRELIDYLTPFPEDVNLIVDARRDLETAYEQYKETHSPMTMDMQASYQAASDRIHQMFLFATGRSNYLRNYAPSEEGRIFLTHRAYRAWSVAVHSVGYATRNDISVWEKYDYELPRDAVFVTAGQDRGCFRVAPDLIVVPGVRFFESSPRNRNR